MRKHAKYARILGELALATRRACARDRLRLGRLRGSGGARRPSRDGGVAVRRADGVRTRTHRARRGSPTASSFASRTIATCRGRYDGIASIEMFEAVGERYWPSYFHAVRNALKPGARAACRRSRSPTTGSSDTADQSTSSSNTSFPAACWRRRRASSAWRATAGSKSTRYAFGQRLRGNAEALARCVRRAISTPCARRDSAEQFIRCWRFYLAYCAAGFASGTTDVAQYTLSAA